MKDTESIVAKAIRDGGIDAVIDHANGWMLSKETADIYSTPEPAAAFHARTAFCLDIHNEVPCPSIVSEAALILTECSFQLHAHWARLQLQTTGHVSGISRSLTLWT